MHLTKLTPTTHDVGGIPVTRLLPKARHRTIGAWCFLDHAGPATFEAGNPGMQVGAHPHTNLQTFTWMLAGEVLHRDSLGSVQRIRPGQVNLMTAGTGDQRGICHTEQTPEDVHDLHAVQLWIALPMNRQIEPSFHHYPELPRWSDDGVHYTLVTGTYQGHTAPTLQYSPLVGIDVKVDSDLPVSAVPTSPTSPTSSAAPTSIPAPASTASPAQQSKAVQAMAPDTAQAAPSPLSRTITLTPQVGFEYGVLVLKGSVTIDDITFGPDELAKLVPGNADTTQDEAIPVAEGQAPRQASGARLQQPPHRQTSPQTVPSQEDPAGRQTAPQTSPPAEAVHIHATPGSHFMLLGGEPLPHPTLVWWNFIADTPQALQQAVADWNSGHPRFGSIDLSGTRLSCLPAPDMPGARIW